MPGSGMSRARPHLRTFASLQKGIRPLTRPDLQRASAATRSGSTRATNQWRFGGSGMASPGKQLGGSSRSSAARLAPLVSSPQRWPAGKRRTVFQIPSRRAPSTRGRSSTIATRCPRSRSPQQVGHAAAAASHAKRHSATAMLGYSWQARAAVAILLVCTSDRVMRERLSGHAAG